MQGKKPDSLILKGVCLLAPMSLGIELDLGSQVFLTEFVVPFVALFFYATKRGGDFHHHFQYAILLGLIYFAGQFISDIWNETPYEQYIRGWSRIILFLINLCSIYVLIDNRRSRLILFCLGFALGRIWITFSGFEGDGIPWKLGLAKPIALIVILVCLALPLAELTRAYASAALLTCLGLFDILMDFRSHGSVLLLVAAILVTTAVVRSRPRHRKPVGLRPAFGLLLAVGMAGFGAYQFYGHAARSGWLSEQATGKYQAQVEETDTPLLIAGRSEVLVYFEAIFDSILVGHGSWPKNAYYAEKLAEERYDRNLGGLHAKDDSIPIHSHLFGSMIEAGLLGGLFWANALILIFRSIMRSSAGSSPMRPLYLYGAILLCWDIFFSPFSGFRRLESAFLIVIVLRSLLQRQVFAVSRKKYAGHRSWSGTRRKQRRRGSLDEGDRRRQVLGETPAGQASAS